MSIDRLECSVYKYAFDVEIKASPEKVWTLLTTDISTWWSKDFHSSPDTLRFVMEPKVGGRLYEDQGDDRGVLWGHVVQFDPPKRVQIQGAMFPEYGGPGTFILSCQVEPSKDGCILKVSDALFGYVTEAQVAETKDGWMQIFGGGLKKAAETAG